MDGKLQARAIILGVNVEKYEVLAGRELSDSDVALVAKNCALELLVRARDLDLSDAELVRYRSELDTYLDLRSFLSAENAAIAIEHDARHYLIGLRRGISFDELSRVTEAGVSLDRYFDSIEASITFDDLVAASALTSSWRVGEYIDARKAGIGHDDLIAMLPLTEIGGGSYERIGIDRYVMLRGAGTTHAEIMSLLERPAIDIANYVRAVTRDKRDTRPLPAHLEILEAIESGAPVGEYLAARKVYLKEILDAVIAAGLDLNVYCSFRDNNNRITHEEILAYVSIPHSVGRDPLNGINDFIKLIDAGFDFIEIVTAAQAGISLGAYWQLRGPSIGCTQAQVLEMTGTGIDWYVYRNLRHKGIGHDDIIAAARM